MYAGDRQRAIAYGEADSSCRTRAHVAPGEDAWDRCLQRAGFAVGQGPVAALGDVGAGEEVAEVVAGDGFGEPGDVGFGADEDEDRGNREVGVGLGLAIIDVDGFGMVTTMYL